MRRPVVLAIVAFLVCAVQAFGSDLTSVDVSGIVIRLGMTKTDLAAGLPSQFELIDVADMIPTGVQYFQDHGEQSFIAHTGQPQSAVAWITFEGGRVTRVSRLIQDLEAGTAYEMAKSLVAGLRSAFGEEQMPLIVSSGSYTVDGQSFEYLEARAGLKRVVVRALPSGTQINEELGRRDIPVAQ